MEFIPDKRSWTTSSFCLTLKRLVRQMNQNWRLSIKPAGGPGIVSGKMLSGGPESEIRTLWTFTDISEQKLIESQKEEAFYQIQKNLAELAVLNDGVRNPLTIIAGQAELMLGCEAEKILAQVKEIDNMINQLDQRWFESAKILKYLHRHHDILYPPG